MEIVIKQENSKKLRKQNSTEKNIISQIVFKKFD